MNDRPKVKRRHETVAVRFWKWVRPIVVLVVVMGAIRSSLADWNDVPTGSMNPTILEGDRIFVNKLAYDLKVPFTQWRLARWDAPQRGDIIVFESPADGTRLVKRVVGLPGDVVELRDDRLIINGQAVAYEDIDESASGVRATELLDSRAHAIQVLPLVRAMRDYGPVTVESGHYFVMGDNRDNSLDSRYFGTVRMDLIAGRAGRVALSVDPNEHYAPRWERFGKPLP